MPAVSQPNSPEDFSGFTPEAPDPHIIERDLDPLQRDVLHPEPVEQERAGAPSPEAVEWQERASALTPEPLVLDPIAGAVPPEPVEQERAGAIAPEAVEWQERTSALSPEPVEVPPPEPSRQPENVDADTTRNMIESPSPIEWVDRSIDLGDRTAPGGVDVVVPVPHIDPARLRFLDTYKTSETYWID